MSWISLDFVEFGENYEMYSEFPYDIRHKYKLNVLNGYVNKKGYKVFSFSLKGKSKIYLVHRLIYYALIEHYDLNDKKLEIDHINHLRDDNRIDNLRLVTQSDNYLNKSKNLKVIYNFIKDVPDKVVVNKLHKIYYSPSNDMFYRDLGIHFREMHENKSYAHYEINYSFEGKTLHLNTSKWRKDNGY